MRFLLSSFIRLRNRIEKRQTDREMSTKTTEFEMDPLM